MLELNNVVWRVREVSPRHPALKNSDSSYTLGSCDNSNHTIYISEGLTDKKFKKVLCHEIVHAAMFSYDVKLSLMEEEYVADLIANYGGEILRKANQIFSDIRKRETL